MEKFVYGRRKIRFCSSVSGNEPQENAVELAQLGEGCRGHADPCREWIISSKKNLRDAKKLLFAILKA